MSSTGFGTCSGPPGGPYRFQRTGTTPRRTDSIDVTAGHRLAIADKGPPGLVFLPVEAERLADGWRHRSFGVILLFLAG
jgi:hypothetical protein